MVVLIADFERPVARGVTKGLETSDVLIGAECRGICSAHSIASHLTDGVGDVLLKGGDDGRALGLFLSLLLIQLGDHAINLCIPARLAANRASDQLEQLVVPVKLPLGCAQGQHHDRVAIVTVASTRRDKADDHRRSQPFLKALSVDFVLKAREASVRVVP